MGNNVSSCCGAGDGIRCCCLGRGGGNVKSGKMVPADLHSSGAQTNTKSVKKQVVQSRPTTLPTQNPNAGPSTSTSQARQGENNAKFSEFSLHGVQKTSPVEQTDDSMDGLHSSGVQRKFLMENVSSLFNEYKEIDCDEILAEGISKFCNDLEVDPAEFIVLALAWKFKAATMCRFSRDEFTQGCISLQADSIKSIKQSFPELENEAKQSFRDIYKFAFQFGLDSDQGQRSLPSDVAIGMWQVVFSKNPPVLLKDWIKFLEESKIRGISRDTWNMFLHFTENVGSDLSNYDDNEAWPSLFDDFVEYYRMSKVDEGASEKSDNEQSTDDQKQNILEGPQSLDNEINVNNDITVTHKNADLNLPGSVPVIQNEPETILSLTETEQKLDSVDSEIQPENNTEKDLVLNENDIENSVTVDSDQLHNAEVEEEVRSIKPNSTLENDDGSQLDILTQQTFTSELNDENEESKTELSQLPSTSEDINSEFDSEPIRCETLHSSHLS